MASQKSNTNIARALVDSDRAVSIGTAVFTRGGAAYTNSWAVALVFGKRHDNVLRAIDGVECSARFSSLNFEPTEEREKVGATTRTIRTYDMTKDGFAFLVMGFTGKEAARFKESYIAQFNAMEDILRRDKASEIARRGDGMLRMAVHKITAMERRMQEMEARWNEGAALTVPRVAVVSGMTAKEFLDMQKVPSRGRRGLVQRVSSRVMKFSAKHGYQVDFCRRTGTRVFMPRALEDWYTNGGGSLLVRAHMDALAGQRRLFPVDGGKLAA